MLHKFLSVMSFNRTHTQVCKFYTTDVDAKYSFLAARKSHTNVFWCFETYCLSLIVFQRIESPNHGRRCLRLRILIERNVVVGRREKEQKAQNLFYSTAESLQSPCICQMVNFWSCQADTMVMMIVAFLAETVWPHTDVFEKRDAETWVK